MNDEQNVVYIYVLSDPRDGCVRYVGITKDPQMRIIGHDRDKNNPYKREWLQSMAKDGFSATMTIIESVQNGEYFNREAYWIKHYLDNGYDLVNMKRDKTGYDNLDNPTPKPKKQAQQSQSPIRNVDIAPEKRLFVDTHINRI